MVSTELGDRLPPLGPDQLSPDQREAVAELSAGPRGGVVGPFIPLLRAPELTRRVQRVGEYFRWGDCSLPADVRELAILLVARQWSQQIEWSAHRPIAEAAGVAVAACDEIAAGRRPDQLTLGQQTAYRLVTELLANRSVSDATFAEARERFDEHGVIELTALTGYYTTLAMVMNTARTPDTSESPSPLPPLG